MKSRRASRWSWTSRPRSISRKQRRVAGRRAADQHVSVRRERSPRQPGFSPRDSRFRRTGPVDRSRASGFGGRWSIRRSCGSIRLPTTIRAALAWCSATAISTTTRTTACFTTAGRASGSSRSRAADGRTWGRGAVRSGRDSDVATKPSTTSSPSGSGTISRTAGQQRKLAYRLSVGLASGPPLDNLATSRPRGPASAAWSGSRGTISRWRFVVDFAGGPLGDAGLGREGRAGDHRLARRIELTSARPLAAIDGWRAMFDLKPTDDSTEPIDLRLYLAPAGRTLTETWLYQWTPPPASERKF